MAGASGNPKLYDVLPGSSYLLIYGLPSKFATLAGVLFGPTPPELLLTVLPICLRETLVTSLAPILSSRLALLSSSPFESFINVELSPSRFPPMCLNSCLMACPVANMS